MVPVQLWESGSWHQLLSLIHSDGQVESVAFSPDDRVLATAGDGGAVHLFDAQTGKLLDLLTGHAGRVWCVAFAPDGRTLATAGRDGTVRLWDPEARPGWKVLPGSPGHFLLTFSPDGKRLVGGGHMTGELRIWEAPSGQLEISVLPGARPHDIRTLALAPDGRTLATGHFKGLVTVWDFPEARPRLTIEVPERASFRNNLDVGHLAFTADGKTLLTNGLPLILHAWDVSTGHLQGTLTPAHVKHVGLAYSPKRNLVATGAPDGIVLWDLAAGGSETLPWPGQVPGDGACLAFSPDGAILAGRARNRVLLWDVATRRARPPLSGHQGDIRWMAFLPDGKTLASLSVDGEVKLWSVLTGQELLTLEGPRGPIFSVAFSPDGRMLAVATHRSDRLGEVRLWLSSEAREGPPGSN
jgi:WD40 repeat protein